VALVFRTGAPHLYVPPPVPAGRPPIRTALPSVEARYRDVSELPALLEQVAIESAM
jgi:hypothetical protein